MVFQATNTSSISWRLQEGEPYIRLYVNMPGEMANWLSPVSLPLANCQLVVFKSYIYSVANLHAIRFALALNLWSAAAASRLCSCSTLHEWRFGSKMLITDCELDAQHFIRTKIRDIYNIDNFFNFYCSLMVELVFILLVALSSVMSLNYKN